MTTIDSLSIYTDGSCRGNPGQAGAGAVIYKGNKIIEQISQSLGEATNNIAEYKAVILALKKAKEMKVKKVTLFSDSELLVKQLNGQYRVKNKILMALSLEINQLKREFKRLTITHIPRKENRIANLLAEQAAYKN